MLDKLKKFANSWLGFALILILAIQGVRSWQNHGGKSAFAATGLPDYSLAQAKELATTKNQLIVAELSAHWCGACQQLDRELLSRPEIKTALTRDFVYSRVDETSPEAQIFMDRYGARGYPTLVLLNSAGELIKPLPLTFNAQEFLQSLAP